MKYLQRLRQSTITNQILSVSSTFMMIGTICLAVAAGFQYCTSRNQLSAMRDMIGQNERLIKASSDQATASAKSAHVAESEIQAVNDSATAAKDSAAAAKTLTEQNKELIASARIQANASTVQAKVSERMVLQNERLVTAAQTQATTSQTSAETAKKGVEIAERTLVASNAALIGLRGISRTQMVPGRRIVLALQLYNVGHGAAQITGGARIVVSKNLTIDLDYSQIPTIIPLVIWPDPNSVREVFVPSEYVFDETIDGERQQLFIYGKITWVNIGESKPAADPVEFCYAWHKTANRFFACIVGKKAPDRKS